MNVLVPHLIIAFVFFDACLASVVLYSVHALLSPRRPWGRWIAVPGLFSVVSLAVFLGDCLRLRHGLHDVIRLLSHRPTVWLLPLSEWFVFLSVLLWIILVATQLKSEEKRAEMCPIDFPRKPLKINK